MRSRALVARRLGRGQVRVDPHKPLQVLMHGPFARRREHGPHERELHGGDAGHGGVGEGVAEDEVCVCRARARRHQRARAAADLQCSAVLRHAQHGGRLVLPARQV